MSGTEADALENELLSRIERDGQVADTWDVAKDLGIDHQDLVASVQSLTSDEYVLQGVVSFKYWTLTDEGRDVAERGAPEVALFNAVPEDGAAMNALAEQFGASFKIAMGNCMKKKWIKRGKDGVITRVPGAEAKDEVQGRLREVEASGGSVGVLGEGTKEAKDLKKRKMISLNTRKSFRLEKGPNFRPRRVRLPADITREMMEDGSWASQEFKKYNFNARGLTVHGGYLHPLLKVRTEFRSILLEMGFEEMPTNQWVESCFWNFDALFQPQSHPARDAHDTFFIRDPAKTTRVPEAYLEDVKKIHSEGGFGSIGYNYDWQRSEAFKNILRTHTTAVSARMLYDLGKTYRETGVFTPKKFFSIDRVFRNETTDATHLAEFHQVEFVVCDRGMSLGHLIGLLKTFFARIGITNLRFKPAYNPYTEPSMEVFGFHPDLKKWTEIGNSGIFRPEMVRTMGLPEDVSVIAGGLSLERPTMIKYRISNIRELFGHKVDIDMARNAPVCRF